MFFRRLKPVNLVVTWEYISSSCTLRPEKAGFYRVKEQVLESYSVYVLDKLTTKRLEEHSKSLLERSSAQVQKFSTTELPSVAEARTFGITRTALGKLIKLLLTSLYLLTLASLQQIYAEVLRVPHLHLSTLNTAGQSFTITYLSSYCWIKPKVYCWGQRVLVWCCCCIDMW